MVRKGEQEHEWQPSIDSREMALALGRPGDGDVRRARRAAWAPAGQSGPGTAAGMAPPVAVAAQTGPRIEITKHKFSRPTLTVPAGTTVTWLNRDEDLHTVVSTTQAFKSAGLETDEAYSYKFAKPGVYEYFCTLHPLMTGKVIVK